MELDELLREAERRYYIGVKFKSSFNDNGLIREVQPYSKDNIIIFGIAPEGKYGKDKLGIRFKDGVTTKDGGCSNPLIYEDGEWAEIISLPKRKTVKVNKKDNYLISLFKKLKIK